MGASRKCAGSLAPRRRSRYARAQAWSGAKDCGQGWPSRAFCSGPCCRRSTAASSTSLSQGILMSLYPGERRGTAVALVGVAAVLGPLFGPPLGGLLTDHFGWPTIFWVNVPLGLASLLLLRNLHVQPAPRQEGLDLRGAALLAAALISLQLGCAHRAWLLAPALLFGWLFVKRERTARSPAVDLSVLRYRPLAGTLAAAPLYGVGLYASIFLIPLLFERQLSMTAGKTGLALAAGGVASGILIVAAQPLLSRFPARSLCAVGAAMFASPCCSSRASRTT